MKRFTFLKIVLVVSICSSALQALAQKFDTDTSSGLLAKQTAINFYHQFLFPETGLYNGSEYTYNTYYPFPINEGDPFFQSKNFEIGSVFYNNLLYENVSLLFDLIKGELLIHDPSKLYIIRLNTDKIGWFKLWGHTFIKFVADSATTSSPAPGFYDLLYDGKTSLYARDTKLFKENSASAQGLNKYVVESIEYFIKKDNTFYRIKNKKSLLAVMDNRRKDIVQFVKKNRLNLRKNKNSSLIKVVAYYDQVNK